MHWTASHDSVCEMAPSLKSGENRMMRSRSLVDAAESDMRVERKCGVERLGRRAKRSELVYSGGVLIVRLANRGRCNWIVGGEAVGNGVAEL